MTDAADNEATAPRHCSIETDGLGREFAGKWAVQDLNLRVTLAGGVRMAPLLDGVGVPEARHTIPKCPKLSDPCPTSHFVRRILMFDHCSSFACISVDK